MKGTFINLSILWVTTVGVTGQEWFSNFNQWIFDDKEPTRTIHRIRIRLKSNLWDI